MARKKIAKSEFCFTYYDGEASRDMLHMNRREKGCYIDLMTYIRNFGPVTLATVKKILNVDFEDCWPQVEPVLKLNEEGKYYIGWVDKSIKRDEEYSKSQKAKADEYWDKKQENCSKNTEKMEISMSSGVPVIDIVVDNKDKIEVKEKEKEVKNFPESSPVGMEAASDAARKSYDDVRWRESVCMGMRISLDQLKQWMALFNASISNDVVENFNDKAYRKMLQGWMRHRMARGDILAVGAGAKLSAPPLKKVQNV